MTAAPISTLPGITAQTVTTTRLATRVLFSGAESGTPVLFVHGNASSATYWEETMLALPPEYRGIAPDQRGYGEADPTKKIDATRGMGDLSDDAFALLDTLGYAKAHLIGHSLGGSVIWQMLIDHPERILTITLAAPGSPHGYNGSKGEDGQPCHADFAGSGGGIVNAAFVAAIAAGDRSSDNPQASPRVVMNTFYWKPPFKPAREEELLSSLLSTHTGPEDYPGDSVPSANWPGSAPGVYGPTNGLSPKYAGDVSRIWQVNPKPPILWIRGDSDQIVGDAALFDVGTLGGYGVIPGWPGADVHPSQPMVTQTRAVLERYKGNGGDYREVSFADVGHTPYIERPDEFNQLFHSWMKKA